MVERSPGAKAEARVEPALDDTARPLTENHKDGPGAGECFVCL